MLHFMVTRCVSNTSACFVVPVLFSTPPLPGPWQVCYTNLDSVLDGDGRDVLPAASHDNLFASPSNYQEILAKCTPLKKIFKI